MAQRRVPALVLPRWLPLTLVLALGAVILIPTWLYLPPDDEGLWIEVAPTVFQGKELVHGHYPLWDPWVGFGTPYPLSETLVFHPFLVLAGLLPLALALAILYQVQMWVGLLSVWAVSRYFGLERWVAGLCVLTYALSSTTLSYLTDFWPAIFVQWTLAPLLLLLLLELLDAEGRRARALWSIGAGLCAALMVIDGHVGFFPDFAVGFVAFLLGVLGRSRRLLPWWGLALGVFGAGIASRVYDIAIENSRTTVEHYQERMPLDWARLLLYPISTGNTELNHYRLLAIGGPAVLLALVGLVWRGVSHRYVNGLRAGALASFLLLFFPIQHVHVLSGDFVAAAPFIVFAVPLAGLALHTLWARRPGWRPLLAALALVQVAALVGGFVPFYRLWLNQTIVARDDGRTPVYRLEDLFKDRPIYRSLRAQPGIRSTRVYMAPGAEDRLYRSLSDYSYTGFALHGVRLVNGEFRGLDVAELQPMEIALHGEVRANDTLAQSPEALSSLGIGYVLATPHDRVDRSLRRVATFRVPPPAETIVAYRNPGVWGDAAVLSRRAKALGPLPLRHGCDAAGLLCGDFASVARLRVPSGVRDERWRDTTLHVDLAPQRRASVLMVSQLFRPGWQARLSNGETAHGYKLIGGLTGFDLPPDVTSASVSYHQGTRIALTILTWVTIFAALAAMALLALRLPRRRDLPA